jgi:hypothetical protein
MTIVLKNVCTVWKTAFRKTYHKAVLYSIDASADVTETSQ